jgi:hypothetical protein
LNLLSHFRKDDCQLIDQTEDVESFGDAAFKAVLVQTGVDLALGCRLWQIEFFFDPLVVNHFKAQLQDHEVVKRVCDLTVNVNVD